jgi:2-iminobutanoate/2-iminopropanoate deaminase
VKKIINTEKAPKPVGPYSQAVLLNGTLYLSGQIAIDPATNAMVTGSIEEETEQVLINLKNVLESAGSSLDKVLKTTCYLTDINDFPRFNAVYEKYFKDSKPARSTVEVSKLPKGALVEIDVIAYAG